MNHYTYSLTFEDGRRYIGVRSCKCKPTADIKYLGSSRHTRDLKVIQKDVLGSFANRAEAVEHEILLHDIYDVARSPRFINKAKQTSLKFDTTGVKFAHSPEHRQKIKDALTGRKRSPEECAAMSAAIKGRPRKPHSDESRRKMSEARKGVRGYKRGERYDPEHHAAAYASRTKYSGSYDWIHENGDKIRATCIEMGQRFGSGVKPTRSFSLVVKGENKSSHGWELESRTD